MNWKIALVITDYVSGAPVPGVVVTAASSGSAGIGTTDASGAASLVIVVREQSPFLIIGVPSPPAATGAFTTWNMALVLTDYTGIPLAGIDVYLDGGPDVQTDQSGKATVRFKILASAGQAITINDFDSRGGAGEEPLNTAVLAKDTTVTVSASGLTANTETLILD